MIWLDFDNAPHVPLLVPIAKELESRGHRVLCTARDYTQTIPLLEQSGIEYIRVGRSFGKRKPVKMASLALRLAHLYRTVRPHPVALALNHGSRTQTACARLLNIPCIVMADYEYTEISVFRQYATLFYTPKHIPRETLTGLGFRESQLLQYDGYKENIYLQDFKPDPDFRTKNGIPADKIVVTLRPPGTAGNYHDRRSETLCEALLRRLVASDEYFTVLLPKNAFERRDFERFLQRHGRFGNWLIPAKPLPGLQLIWHSDVVVSGGGTMNRESALLGVPAYSIFTAQKGAVDAHLEKIGKLTFLNTVKDVQAVPIERRGIAADFKFNLTSVRDEVIALVERQLEAPGRPHRRAGTRIEKALAPAAGD